MPKLKFKKSKVLFLTAFIFLPLFCSFVYSVQGQDEVVEIQQELSKKQKARQVNLLYKQAIRAYKNNDFDLSVEEFSKILQLEPNHKKAKKYIEILIPRKKDKFQSDEEKRKAALLKRQAAVDKKQQLRQIATLYKKAIKAYKFADLDLSEKKFKEILSLDPGHKNASKYLDKFIPKKRKKLESKEQSKLQKEKKVVLAEKSKEILKEKQRKVNIFYKEAIAAYKAGDFVVSEDKFKNILAVDPGNKKAKKYLEIYLPRKIRAIASQEERKKSILAKLARKRAQKELRELQNKERKESVLDRKAEKLKIKELKKQEAIERKRKAKEQAKKRRDEAIAKKQERAEAKKREKEKKIAEKRERIEAKKRDKEERIAQRQKEKEEALARKGHKTKQEKILEKIKAKQERLNKKKVDKINRLIVQQQKVLEKRNNKLSKLLEKKVRLQKQNLINEEKKAQIVQGELGKLKEKAEAAKAKGEKKYIQSLYSLASFAAKKRLYEDSIDAFNTILDIDSSQLKARDYVNIHIPKLKRKDEIIKKKKRKIERNHEINSLYIDALKKLQDGNYKEAKESFVEILVINPKDKHSKMFLDDYIPFLQDQK